MTERSRMIRDAMKQFTARLVAAGAAPALLVGELPDGSPAVVVHGAASDRELAGLLDRLAGQLRARADELALKAQRN
jgi:hypothetical protein